MRKKYWIRLAEALLIVIAVLTATSLYTLRQYELIDTQKISAISKPYKVESGMTSRTISEELTRGQYPKLILRLWLQRHPQLQAVQKGRYRIDGKKNLAEILSDMVQGKVVEEEYPQLAIIEGSNISSLRNTLKKLLPKQYPQLSEILDKPADFIIESLKHDQTLLQAIGGAGSSLEGLLMPATYPVFHQNRPFETLGTALRATARFMAAEWPNKAKEVFVNTPYEALIVASIIERETLVNEERPHVAAVFYNRLRKKMRLQTDPTVMYGISPDFSGKLTKEMLKKDSPYNTYTRAGLPPTPISMPSKSSILAALHPAKTDALYFVAADISPTQGHVFTGSLDDHNKAVADYRRKVSEYKKTQNTAKKKEEQKTADSPKNDQRTKSKSDKPVVLANNQEKNEVKKATDSKQTEETTYKKASASTEQGTVLSDKPGETVIYLEESSNKATVNKASDKDTPKQNKETK